ncbi:MAG: peptidase M15, partial [Rickettsiaceae bacterium]|nr:peptidase M15 [Rickettsiaceae bacterium]
MKFSPSIFLYLCIISANVYANELKSGFVYLSDIDPSISISLKYHSDKNFTGKRVRGCNTGRAVLTLNAANALRSVQEDLLTYGYSLVVYDAYRPKKSYDEFNDWLQNESSKG